MSNSETERVGDILGKMQDGVGGAVKLCQLLSLWGTAVDEKIARNSTAKKICHRVLYVSASSPAWAEELSFLKKEIMQKFNSLAGEEVIKDIRFSAV
jgi:predicted nucleic acid-binding Zn ribbon protein